MTSRSKKSDRTTASTRSVQTAAPAAQRKPHSKALRRRMSIAAKKAIKRTPIAERIRNIDRERQMEALPLTDEPWLSLREIAIRTGFSYLTVQRWTYKGLRYRRFGRTIRVPLSELDRFSGSGRYAA
jgi:excisionase family DNA binding protein